MDTMMKKRDRIMTTMASMVRKSSKNLVHLRNRCPVSSTLWEIVELQIASIFTLTVLKFLKSIVNILCLASNADSMTQLVN